MESNNIVKDYTKFYGKFAKLRKPSPIRELFKYTLDPTVISLGGGLPNPNAFPFKKITVELKESDDVLEIQGEELATALQYTQTAGIPKLISWLKNLQIHNHKLPTDNKERPWSLGITAGSQEALALAISTFLDEGDSLVIESPTYSGTLSILGPMGLNMVSVGIDKYGMVPSQLEHVLSSWSTLYPCKPFPKLLYTIPTGQNPSGVSMNVDRKREIYQICSKYDLLILEDDPYYYLQFEVLQDDLEKGLVVQEEGQPILGVSLLSMDVDQRVIRFDSLSKILSSGLRLGFMTGPTKLLELIQCGQQATTLHASGVSQTLALSLLNQWGLDGFHQHILKVQSFYRERRKVFLECVERHLKGLVEFVPPSAGMFVWFKVLNSTDTLPLITSKALEKKVVLVPGIAFEPNPHINPTSSYVRASFSIANDQQMDEACKRFASLLKEL